MTRANDTTLRVYSPGPRFDDKLAGVARWMADHGMAIPGLEPATLAAAAETERRDATDDERRLAETRTRHQQYVVARQGRYDLFQKAVGAARSLARRNPEMLRELLEFRLRARRSRNGAAPQAAPEAPAATGASKDAAADAA